MENLPIWVGWAIALTTFLTAFLLYKATRSRLILGISIILLLLQTILGLKGFYQNTTSFPPPLPLLIGPALIGIIILFSTRSGRKLLDSFDQRWMTWLSIIRVPVEFVLLALFIHKLVPQVMTFEGRNFDILSGLSAPFIAYYGYTKRKISRPALLLWNFICLGLLLNVVIHAVLAVPGPLQRIAFDQPNIAVLYFPFVWLPGFIVPAVLFSHLVNIRQLLSAQPSSLLSLQAKHL
jgi:multidrug transporter EmrE-like cation transporter